MNDVKYIGLDVHQAMISATVLDCTGKLVFDCIMETKAALLIALLQTPHRFRTKRQMWAYSCLAWKTSSSGEYRFVEGRLKRSKKFLAIRGLNANHNHDLKNNFKGAATWSAAVPGPSRRAVVFP
jgi:transposase